MNDIVYCKDCIYCELTNSATMDMYCAYYKHNRPSTIYGCDKGKKKPNTNADRIRAMSDEELAELLHSQFVFSNSYLPSKWWVDWLKQEVET